MLFYRTFPALHYLGESEDKQQVNYGGKRLDRDGNNQQFRDYNKDDKRYNRDEGLSHVVSVENSHDKREDKYQKHKQGKHRIETEEKYKYQSSGSKRKSSELSTSTNDKSPGKKSAISFKFERKVILF